MPERPPPATTGDATPQRLDAGHAPAVLAFEPANRAYFAASISDRGDDFFAPFTDRWERHRGVEPLSGISSTRSTTRPSVANAAGGGAPRRRRPGYSRSHGRV